MGKYHGGLARSGKVKNQTPRVPKDENKPKKPSARVLMRKKFNKRIKSPSDYSPNSVITQRRLQHERESNKEDLNTKQPNNTYRRRRKKKVKKDPPLTGSASLLWAESALNCRRLRKYPIWKAMSIKEFVYGSAAIPRHIRHHENYYYSWVWSHHQDTVRPPARQVRVDQRQRKNERSYEPDSFNTLAELLKLWHTDRSSIKSRLLRHTLNYLTALVEYQQISNWKRPLPLPPTITEAKLAQILNDILALVFFGRYKRHRESVITYINLLNIPSLKNLSIKYQTYPTSPPPSADEIIRSIKRTNILPVESPANPSKSAWLVLSWEGPNEKSSLNEGGEGVKTELGSNNVC